MPPLEQPGRFAADCLRAFRSIETGLRLVIDEVYSDPNEDPIPQFNYRTGRYNRIADYVPMQWPGFPWVGFLMGRLWLAYDRSGDGFFAEHALRLARRIGPYLASRPLPYADAGLDIYYGLCIGYELTGETALRDWALAGVRNLSASYKPDYRAIFQHAQDLVTYIDMPFAFQACYWAARFDRRLLEPVLACNDTVLTSGLVREDGSTNHAVQFDPDTKHPDRLLTRQGKGDRSTWTRGQAWAIHNFTNAFEATGEQRFFDAACRTADWYLAHVPADHVPFYDFDDPDRDSIPRDSCSTAIVANALIRLIRLRPDLEARYWGAARAGLQELMANYLSPCGVLLHGSWGRVRKTWGIGAFPQQDIMPYGNYWIAEALYRLLQPNWRVFQTIADPEIA